jgi:xylose isomerase
MIEPFNHSPAMSQTFPLSPVRFEGAKSRNPLSFKVYNPDELVEGKSMREHLRFASPYWHTMRNPLGDPFGVGTAQMPWDDGTDSTENALRRVDVFFEFLEKIGIDFYCFHDRDVSPERGTIAETEADFDRIAERLKARQDETGRKLLWGTACLFAHPRFAQGAATSPDVHVYAFAAAQVKKAMEVTHQLGGEGYTFWGGREGYNTLVNTDLKREREHLAAFLHMAVAFKKEIGFTGQFYIEPKPQEPTTHQYDSDSAACLNFLREFGLLEHFKLNLETNHATLAGKTMVHEMRVARHANALGSVDANQGTFGCGWDTDEFPSDLYLTTGVMLEILEMGGFTTGGLNFDAKRRRESFEPIDLFHSHILGMDAFARGLKVAAALRADGRIAEFVRERYASWDGDLGRKIEAGKSSFAELHAAAVASPAPALRSGRQEWLESIVNQVLFE